MNRHTNHIIDSEAQTIFRQAIPSKWVINEQRDDYGKDYLVELVDDDGNLTGSSFYVQLKGHQRSVVKGTPPAVGHSLEKKHLEYYADRVHDLPVFLFVVDVTRKTGYWIFLQKELLENEGWRKKKSFTVRVPVANDIFDTVKLQTGISDAKNWLKSKFPPPIAEIIATKRQVIQKLDARFDVKVIGDRFEIFAMERIPLTVTPLKKESAHSKIAHMFDTGVETHFEPGEIRLDGSKLFERVELEGGSIYARVSCDASASFVAYDEFDRQIGRLDNVDGKIQGGRRQLNFIGQTRKGMLSVQIGLFSETTAGKTTITFRVRTDQWSQTPLLLLPFFEQISPFFIACLRASKTTVEFFRDGNRVSVASFPLHAANEIHQIGELCQTISKARVVARHFAVNPFWSGAACDDDMLDNIDQLHALITEGVWKRPHPNVRIRAVLGKGSSFLGSIPEIENPTTFCLSSSYIYEFFDTEINVGRLSHFFTEMSVEQSESEGIDDERVIYLAGNDQTTEEIMFE